MCVPPAIKFESGNFAEAVSSLQEVPEYLLDVERN